MSNINKNINVKVNGMDKFFKTSKDINKEQALTIKNINSMQSGFNKIAKVIPNKEIKQMNVELNNTVKALNDTSNSASTNSANIERWTTKVAQMGAALQGIKGLYSAVTDESDKLGSKVEGVAQAVGGVAALIPGWGTAIGLGVQLAAPFLGQLVDMLTEATDETKSLREAEELRNEMFASSAGAMKAEIDTIRVYTDVLKDNNSSQAQRKAAFDALNETYPTILKNLTQEKLTLEDINRIQNEANQLAIRRKLEAAYQDKMNQLSSNAITLANQRIRLDHQAQELEEARAKAYEYRNAVEGTVAAETKARLEAELKLKEDNFKADTKAHEKRIKTFKEMKSTYNKQFLELTQKEKFIADLLGNLFTPTPDTPTTTTPKAAAQQFLDEVGKRFSQDGDKLLSDASEALAKGNLVQATALFEEYEKVYKLATARQVQLGDKSAEIEKEVSANLTQQIKLREELEGLQPGDKRVAEIEKEIQTLQKAEQKLLQQQSKLESKFDLTIQQRQEQFNEKALEFNKAYIEAQQKASEEFRKSTISTREQIRQTLIESGNLPSLVAERQRIEDVYTGEMEGLIKETKEMALAQLSQFGLTEDDLVGLDTGHLNVDDILSRIEDLNPFDAQKIKTLLDNRNLLMSSVKDRHTKDLADLQYEFTDMALNVFKDQTARDARLFEVSIAELNLEHSKSYSELVSNEAEIMKKELKEMGKLSPETKAEIEKNTNTLVTQIENIYATKRKFLIERMEEQLALIRAQGGDTEIQERELKVRLAKLEAEEKAALDKVRNRVKPDSDEPLDPKEIAKVVAGLVNDVNSLLNSINDMVMAQFQRRIDTLMDGIANLDARIQESANRANQLEDDLEGKRSGRRDAVLAALELEKQREAELTAQKLEMEARLQAAEEEAAKKRKEWAIGQALINGALAITNIWATPTTLPDPAGTIYKGVMTGIVAATTAVQVATISQQQFADGGFTGDGSFIDSTGHKVAGVVHNDEWVAPKWMVESPKFAPMIDSLERIRQQGFANGGYTSPKDTGMTLTRNNSNIEFRAMVKEMQMLADRPIFASIKDINQTQERVNRRMNVTSTGRR